MPNAKGTTLLGAVRFLRRHRELALEHLKPELHRYLDERILEAKWYPEADLLALIEAMLPLIPGPRDEVLASMGAHSAREHLQGIYSHLTGGRSATPSPSQAFALWASQHDTGRLKIESSSPDEMVMSVRDFGHPSETMCGIFGGYFAELLRLQGARDVRVTQRECVLRGAPQCSWMLKSRVRSG